MNVILGFHVVSVGLHSHPRRDPIHIIDESVPSSIRGMLEVLVCNTLGVRMDLSIPKFIYRHR